VKKLQHDSIIAADHHLFHINRICVPQTAITSRWIKSCLLLVCMQVKRIMDTRTQSGQQNNESDADGSGRRLKRSAQPLVKL
jgi:hypothetical protein